MQQRHMITARQLLSTCRNAIVVNAMKHSSVLIATPTSFTRDEFEAAPATTYAMSTVVVYCANWHCSASEHFCDELKRKNFENVVEFKGGILEWAMCASLFDTFRFTDRHHAPIEVNAVYQHLLASAEARYQASPPS